MKITNIKQQVKRADRYSIYVDEKYAFSFSEAELLNLGLSIGQEFDEAGLAALKKSAIQDKAYTRALDLIYRRIRSEWELHEYLRRKEYEPDVIETTIQRLRAAGYMDDKKFAVAWVENRRLLKSTSQRKLRLELKQKRIADDIINEVLSEDPTDERTVLQELVQKKRRQSRYQDETKLMQYLLRQGFSYNDVKAVIKGQ